MITLTDTTEPLSAFVAPHKGLWTFALSLDSSAKISIGAVVVLEAHNSASSSTVYLDKDQEMTYIGSGTLYGYRHSDDI